MNTLGDLLRVCLPTILGLAILLHALPAPAAPAWPPKHPVLGHRIDPAKAAQYERAVAHAMAMSDDELLAFVPDKPFAAWCECPKCYGGVEGNHIFKWTIERPNEMTCKYCGTVFPNAKYPEDHELSGKNALGETVTFKFYLNTERNIPHLLTSNLDRWRREWVMSQCVALGKAYQATGKEEYARRAVLILDRAAQVYPHYPIVVNSQRWKFKFFQPQKYPFPWNAGRWGYFHNEVPKRAIRAYDLVYDSKAFDELSQQRGYDVRKRLEDDFFRETFAAVSVQTHHMSNIIGYDVAGVAWMGRVIHEPRYVHWAFGWMKKTALAGFFYDGLWHESPSYHYMTMGGLRRAFDTIRGYTDPPGYVDKVDRFDDFEPEKVVPFLARLQHAPEVLDLPNGCSTSVHDTHPYERRSKPRERTVSTIAPGYGHASLGRGTGTNQMQAQLHFGGAYGHAHYDNLNLTLWAKEREMLPDLGYTWTQMRYWCTSTLGHNTVVVDRKDQVAGKSDGDLLWYFPDNAGVSAVAADGKRGYRKTRGLDLYRRMLVMIPVSEADAYVVDVFRVRGGAMHDWALHGDADRDTTAACSLPLAGKRKNMLEPGEKWDEPTTEGHRFNAYGMVRDVQRGETAGSFRVDFTYLDEPMRGLRTHVFTGGPAEVWLGRSPSVRRMGQGTGGDMRKAYDFWMPHLLVRRQAQAPLASTFAAIHEPYAGKPFLSRVERLKLSPASEQAVALRVTHGDTVDTIISTLDEPPYPDRATSNGIRLRGRLGIVRQKRGKTTSAWLFEGRSLSGQGWRLDAQQSRYTGEIAAATRKADGAAQDAFITNADLPVGDTLHRAWIIVTHGNGYTHGYEIDRVEKRDGKTTIVLTMDHGLRIDGGVTTEVFFPQRKIKGRNTFSIPLAVSMVGRP